MKSKTKTYIYIVSVAIIVIVIGVLVFIWSRGFGQGPTSSSTLPVGAAQYSNSDLGFSFQYPAEAAIQEPPTDGGFMVTVTDAKASESLQIFVTPFSDAPSLLTPDYIKTQVSDLVINNPKQISVGTSVQGLPSVQGHYPCTTASLSLPRKTTRLSSNIGSPPAPARPNICIR